MTRCVVHTAPEAVPMMPSPEEVHVLLYGGSPVHPRTAAIGAQLRDLYMRLGVRPSNRAVDLVSIALAVTAADTFILRSNSATSWARDIEIEMPLGAPDIWSPVLSDIERTLAFLSGDRWKFVISGNGEQAPSTQIIRRKKCLLDFSATDSVSLFSGGLDSTISMISMLEQGRSPILVSHAYRGDADIQNQIASEVPMNTERISVNAWPTSSLQSDVSMRTRSFLFIAIGVLICDVWSKFHRREPPDFLIPENGFIAINAPLTPRRVGSLSTRTTHPHFLNQMRKILVSVGLPSKICNPYELQTKGEMVDTIGCSSTFQRLASRTVSCSKWKRSNMQCGRCLPCLIRRSALYAGNVDDTTTYSTTDLSTLVAREDESDDLMAVMTAVRRFETENLRQWVSRSGPLPFNSTYRSDLINVFRRGLGEVGNYLRDSGLMM